MPASLAAGAVLLVWPALLNGYPLVFSDTGTYLGQAIERYVGWDRPPFYSLAIFPLHMTRTTWPVVAAQALLAAWLVHLLLRCLYPRAPLWWLPVVTGAVSLTGALPFLVCELMPDLFTPLLGLALALLVLWPERLHGLERAALVLAAAFMIAAHNSNLPVALALLAGLLPLRRVLGARARLGRRGLSALAAPPLLAAAALVAANLAAFGRPALAPYGSPFLLARVLYDGPGVAVLRDECPRPGWRLCDQLDRLPGNADDFLWRPDSPLNRLGGAKAMASEAGAIVQATFRARPGAELRAMAGNAWAQFTRFATGDGLDAWPRSVTPVIERHFPPAELAAYRAARQTGGALQVPPWLQAVHAACAVGGMLAATIGLGLGVRQRHPAAGLCLAALLILAANAAVTGALSGPHDRYQSRVVWMPLLAALLAAPALLHRRPSATELVPAACDA